MNSWLNSMIVLMELSVVNNWQVVMNMYVQMAGSNYYRLFFVAFYFCSVIVVLNVVIAFVINLFLVNYGQNISDNNLLFRYKRYILMAILIHNTQNGEFDVAHWTIHRRIRPALWYKNLYLEDKANARNMDESVDYDRLVMMPFSSGTLIGQFEKFNSDGFIQGHVDPEMMESATIASFNVLSSAMNTNNVINSIRQSALTQSVTQVLDIGKSLNTQSRGNFVITRSVQLP